MLFPIVTVAVVAAALATAACVDHPVGIERVVDGDTVVLSALALPAPLGSLSLRVRGVDSPESGHRARCPEEAALAARAAAFTAAAVVHATGVEICGWDKYGGRVLGDVWLAHGGRLSDGLVASGHAVAYTGRGPRRDWCACPAGTPPPYSREGPDGDGDGGHGAQG